MRQMIKLGLILWMVFCGGMAFADSTDSSDDASNQATVAVVDRSPDALQLALKAAFSEAMVKISGDPQVMSRPIMKKMSLSATQWVQSYSYLELPSTNPNQKPELFLQVVFDGAGLQALLAPAQERAEAARTAVNAPPPSISSSALPSSSLSPSSPSVVMLVVSGVSNIGDYVQVMRSLRAKNDVVHVAVRDVNNNQMAVQVTLSGDQDQFRQLLANDTNFRRADSDGDTASMQYYWIGNQA